MAEKSLSKVELGQLIKTDEGDFEVKAACEHPAQGHWYCVTHREGFANQFQKDGHIHQGAHVLAWICHVHGPEVP